MNTAQFQKMKNDKVKISMVTCYDSTMASIVKDSPIDVILVGDSAAMVMHGHSTTLPATIELMALHTAAVVRGAPDKFVVADMPFLAHRKGVPEALRCAEYLMRAGAHAVKIEGVDGHEDVIAYLIQSGIPVMGHIGLTPQSIHQLGGFRVQGREDRAGQMISQQAQKLQSLGCFALVLECIPTQLAQLITTELQIPTIGIGAGPHTDGQVLVLQDLLGLNPAFKPKFVRTFINGHELVLNAFKQFDQEVKAVTYPSENESYK